MPPIQVFCLSFDIMEEKILSCAMESLMPMACAMESLMPMACPNCGASIVIESVNCGIFRCGVYKLSKQPIDPHAAKPTVDRLLKEKSIWGCGQPFQLMVLRDSVARDCSPEGFTRSVPPLDDLGEPSGKQTKNRLIKCGWI